MPFHKTVPIGPLAVAVTDPATAALAVIEASRAPHAGLAIHLVNAYTVALADENERYRNAISRGVALPDGKPLGWVSALRRDSPVIRQTRGPSLFEAVFDRGREFGITHFLLGSTPAVLELLQSNLSSRYPGVCIVGAESPPFRLMTAEEVEEQDHRIRSSGAAIVWVGLGTPKQDFEAARLAASVPATVIAIGAAFDFVAGTLPQAPSWMLRVGLEWLYRLIREPRRLWRRYLFGNVAFVRAVVRRR
jgi:N-acetylglucosaminyldiphosphoundecaprenol N-acetyl-beta-D-mannosaminyltransferase